VTRTAPAHRRDGLARGVLFCVFFGSGFASLLYQVVWQRVLAIFSGADVYAATMVVATFMLGLGLGSLAGGHLADLARPGWPLRLFALAELATGAFAFFSLRLYYDVFYARLGHLAAWPALMAALLALGLLCTAAAFVLYGLLVAEVGAGRALVITYINPVVAVGLGVAILGERPGAGAVAGLLLILAGSWLSTDSRLPPGPTAVVTRLRSRRRRARELEAPSLEPAREGRHLGVSALQAGSRPNLSADSR
jgi:drug/metabolite transporter (DMT)-like permease